MNRNTRACFGLLLLSVSTSVTLPGLLASDESQATWIGGHPWNCHTIDATSRGADGVKLGDFNRDALMDIVTGWEEGGEIRVYLNPGYQRTKQPWPKMIVGHVKSPEEAIFVDLENDDHDEVVSLTEGENRTIYIHRPSDTPLATSPITSLASSQWESFPIECTVKKSMWMQATPMDVDNRHGIDLFVGSKGSNASIGWLKSPSNPVESSKWTYHDVRPAGWIMSLISVDMDHDRDLDILFSDRKGPSSGVAWLENPGSSANRSHEPWKEHSIGLQNREVMFLDFADFDGNQLPDVAVAVKPSDAVLFLRQPDQSWIEKTIHLDRSNVGTAKSTRVCDVNLDGKADLVYSCEDAAKSLQGIVWLQQDAQGWKQFSLAGEPGVKYDLMQLLDLDTDGDLDIVTCEERDQLGVIWYENPTR